MAAQREGPEFDSLSMWSFHVLHRLVWVFSGYSGFSH